MNFITVVVIRNSVVDDSFIFPADNVKEAEAKFLSFANGTITSDEADEVLDEGYYSYGDKTICITWPQDGMNPG